MPHANNIIVSCSGLRLSADEIALFSELKPWAVILFARNIQSPDQLTALLDDFRGAFGQNELMVLLDQEGGRVSRLPQTHWRVPPSPQVFSKLYQHNKQDALQACYLNNVLIGHELKSAGINVNCAPMLDIPQVDAAGIIHERAFGDSLEQVIALGAEVIKGLQYAAVEPVMKHIPGHGRGRTDSHFQLPQVEADLAILKKVDFVPFVQFNHLSMAMSAHIVYQDIDPELPGSISPKVINEIIRKQIGFDGLLMTDDINMHALTGSIAERSHAAFDAGADVVLHCSGDFVEMKSLLPVVSELSGKPLKRAQRAQQLACAASTDIDVESVTQQLQSLLAASQT
ncbi:beta-N-acetylhexosaminidase [Glaciecola sp. SC05]|uniref:beta-N-acetylhexosaminidase n=1 Tax=Glaciecola sp. SC05 TaxID=1987355 RepID=UPI003527F0B4